MGKKSFGVPAERVFSSRMALKSWHERASLQVLACGQWKRLLGFGEGEEHWQGLEGTEIRLVVEDAMASRGDP